MGSLNKQILQLQQLSRQRGAEAAGRNVHNFSSNVVVTLQQKLANMSSQFKQVLDVRTEVSGDRRGTLAMRWESPGGGEVVGRGGGASLGGSVGCWPVGRAWCTLYNVVCRYAANIITTSMEPSGAALKFNNHVYRPTVSYYVWLW